VHPAVTGTGQLGRGARQAGAAEVLDADHQSGVEQLQAALDEDLLHEGVTHLHRRELLAAARRLLAREGLAGEHRHTADAVQPGARTEQDDLVAGARGEREVQVLRAHRADAQGVDERVAEIALVEDDLTTDVRQSE
jgi:hypothetical protein